MSADTVALSSLDSNGSLGALEIGTLVGVFLFGIETLQTFNYYRHFPKDPNLLKAAVGLVWVLELGHTISAAHALYSQTVTFYGQPAHILSPPISEEFTVLFAAPIYTVVQTFFANRVRILSGQWYVMALACVLGLLRFVGHMGIAVLMLHYSRVSIVLQWRWLVNTSLSLDLSADILITASLCYCLWNMRLCESKRTRTMVDTLMLWAIGEFYRPLLRLFAHDDFQNQQSSPVVWAGFFVIQSKRVDLFSNAMLASLNGRRRLREYDGTHLVSDITIGSSHRKADVVAVSFAASRRSSMDEKKQEEAV
ncbi:hypothetical protein B0H12DRAFT_1071102 [Mycena haematopus]|nr:hypothetical protein B0H12DRAFT_1071102 [Mycena haematopus]